MQPRLSDWPLWLAEGFAEYCATPARTKKGFVWDRLGTINALHMATLRELDDPLSNELVDDAERARAPARPSRLVDSGSLVTKTRLTPTDYSKAWALTHYLAQKPNGDFVKFLKSMSQMPPLEPRTPEEHLAEFRKFFGDDLAKVDKEADEYIRKIHDQQGNFLALPWYAVIFDASSRWAAVWSAAAATIGRRVAAGHPGLGGRGRRRWAACRAGRRPRSLRVPGPYSRPRRG